MGRQSKKSIKRKVEVLDEIVIRLKESSRPSKNNLTLNKLLSAANEEFKKLGLDTISPTTFKGEKKSKEYEKYGKIVDDFEEKLKDSKNYIKNNTVDKVEMLERQVENLLVELIEYRDRYFEMEKDYENSQLVIKKLKLERDDYRNKLTNRPKV